MNNILSVIIMAICIGIFIPWIPGLKRRHHLIVAFLLISFTAIAFPKHNDISHYEGQ